MQTSCFLLDFMSWSAHDRAFTKKKCMLNFYYKTPGKLAPSCCRFAPGGSINCPKNTSFCTHRGSFGSVSTTIPHPMYIESAAPEALFAESLNSSICFGYGKGGLWTEKTKNKRLSNEECFGEVGG